MGSEDYERVVEEMRLANGLAWALPVCLAVDEAPGGGFMGVHSLSEETPIKSGNFSLKDQGFEGAEHYTKWIFAYSPPGLGGGIAPGGKR